MSKIRSMRGDIIDMNALRSANEKTSAVGNAKMNARGDRLGRDGRVVKTKEQVVEEYYRSNPRAVEKAVPLRSIEDEVMTPAEALKRAEEMGAIAPKPHAKKKLKFDD